MRVLIRRSLGAAFVAGFALLSTTARADPAADKALAAELFKQGRKLMAEKRTAEACETLAESQRLVPADGTLLNLAVCYEELGKTATAYAMFTEARARALQSKRADRVELAEKRLAALEPRLSRLTVSAGGGAEPEGLRVLRDGSEIGRAAWGVAMPLDPGEHRIEALAPGHKPWSLVVVLGPDADAKTVELPPLEREETAASPPVEPVRAPPPQPMVRAPRRAPEAEPAAPASSTSGGRVAAYGLGGVSLVAVGVGSYFGVRALSKWSESDDQCKNDRCTKAGIDAAEDARTAADVSTVAFVIGGVAFGVGTWLYLDSEPTVSVQARASTRGASASVGARF